MFNTNKGFKLIKLEINKYKRFRDFKISFTDLKNDPLPIIVIAGINGSGKTTVLDCIYNPKSDFKIKVKVDNKEIEASNYSASFGYERKDISQDYYYDDIIYFSTDTNLQSIKTFLPKYIDNMIYNKGVAPFDSYKKVTEFINKILKEFNIQIEFANRDSDGNLYFRNKNGGDKFSIDKLSTGEKTLLSKVLYLYLKEIKDSVILIDEPELSLHPKWQSQILKLYENFAKEYNCQIIIATHSPHILGSAINEYIRLLTINEDNEIEVINDVQAYGRDIKWILEEVMGTEYTREKIILDRFDEIQELINKSNFKEAEDRLEELEKVIGSDDSMILKLRNDLAFERIDFEENC